MRARQQDGMGFSLGIGPGTEGVFLPSVQLLHAGPALSYMLQGGKGGSQTKGYRICGVSSSLCSTCPLATFFEDATGKDGGFMDRQGILAQGRYGFRSEHYLDLARMHTGMH